MKKAASVLTKPYRLIAPLLCVTVAGCTGVFKPYPSAKEPHPYQDVSAEKPVTMERALAWANSVRQAYRDGLDNQGYLSTIGGGLIIPFAGILTYQGVTGTNPHAIAGAAVGGATLLGATSWLESKPRALIYSAADGAVSCAIKMVRPQYLGNEQPIIERISNLSADTARLQLAISAAKHFNAASAHGPSIDVTPAETMLTQAKHLSTQSTEAVGRSRGAANALIDAVDAIIVLAEQQIVTTVPDPRALASGLSGLSFLPATPADIVAASQKKPLKAAAAAPLPADKESIEAELKEAASSTSASMANLSALVGTAKAVSDEELSACNVDLKKIVKPFAISPADETITFKAGDDNKHVALVSGGKTPYSAKILSMPSKGTLTADVVVDKDNYVISIRGIGLDESSSGYSVAVSDNGGNIKILSIVVAAKK